MLVLVGVSFLAGLFTALSPCILPVLPAILASGVGERRLRPFGTILGLIFSFSFFTLSLTWIVHRLGISPNILRYIAIALVFFFGLVMVFPSLSNWFTKWTNPIANLGQKIKESKPSSGFWGGVFFGVALGLLWTPCAGPILAAITTIVATRPINAIAILMTLSYSIGAGIPMFLFAYGSKRLIQCSKLLSHYSEKLRQFFGILMILFAILLACNWDILLNEKLSGIFYEIFSEKNLPIENELKKIDIQENVEPQMKAPELPEMERWINSPAINLSQLKGKVVLIDFWTYSCINCLRTLPYLKNWYRDYKNYGFVIIGIHTPEFAFEKNYNNVKKAVEKLGIDYPVALDNHYATWSVYHNHYWPAHYLIDQKGIIRMVHFGEGMYNETENAIRNLLGLSPLKINQTKLPSRIISPETYLGFARGKSYNTSLIRDQTYNYQYESSLTNDQVGLRGTWKAKEEYILAEGDNCFLDGNFLATHVYLVLSGSSKTPLEVFLDGKFYGQITIEGAQKYDIVATTYAWHQFSLKIPKGIKAYVFNFGDE
jgi:cytochrome c biogenesis protein CcdA/thiol-disulfide isomerase/thioredoxin